ncbi:hypothetical protein [Paenibacillus sp. OV219]|uniref:hypothetical protein n=1 Tax=Paenibacillus sp. OV219 TaxID=1884377 RepID=UPI0008D17639|nr:hypothetical protein [Paenibacillus sp. OV219]SEO06583.1 hypothetical protein SAMN05518847_105397 [Paenibacillus sp. OV219]
MMTKAAQMDNLIEASAANISSTELLAMIHQIFNIDLGTLPLTPLPQSVLEAYLEQAAGSVTGPDVRRMLNETLAVNLDALSGLEGARISLFSKGHWMLQQQGDLFIVHTGAGDVDVTITPTAYYAQQTSSISMPHELLEALVQLGFTYDQDSSSCSYADPSGKPVSDAFKGQTMRSLITFIRTSCASL